jgi:hypothetical protein
MATCSLSNRSTTRHGRLAIVTNSTAASGKPHRAAKRMQKYSLLASRVFAAWQLGLEDVTARHAIERLAEASAAITDEHLLARPLRQYLEERPALRRTEALLAQRQRQ